jgi:hypothetical protein
MSKRCSIDDLLEVMHVNNAADDSNFNRFTMNTNSLLLSYSHASRDLFWLHNKASVDRFFFWRRIEKPSGSLKVRKASPAIITREIGGISMKIFVQSNVKMLTLKRFCWFRTVQHETLWEVPNENHTPSNKTRRELKEKIKNKNK